MLRVKTGRLLLVAAFLFLPWPLLAAGTNVSSSITNPIWTADNSPYIVSGTIEVTKGAVLRVEAGTEIRFNAGAKILVNGELDVLGTAENPVTLTLNTASSTASAWGGIEFTDSAVDAVMPDGQYVSGSIIRNAIIKFGAGIKCADASPFIANNQIMNNSVGLALNGDKASAGTLILNASAAGTNAGVVTPVYVRDNTFSENTVGVLINRNNGRDYVATPAGYSYLGAKVVTAYLLNNTFNSNSIGVSIINGDNNILSGNTLKYSSGFGLQVAAASRGNVLEKNNINNNEIGADIAGGDAVILQNNIKNNFNIGLRLSQKPELLRFNNIYKNQKYNLANTVYNLAAGENYWGDAAAGAIAAGILKSVTTAATASTTAATTVYPVSYDSYLSQEAAMALVASPIFNDFSTTTEAASLEISGLKPVAAAVVINGRVAAAAGNSSQWSAKLDLTLGDNAFSVYYQDTAGQQSDRATVTIRRNNALPAPVLSAYGSATTNGSLILSGSKPAGASIIINDKEVFPADANTAWTYNWPLVIGANSAEIIAHSGEQYSAAVIVSVTRVKNTAADIIAAEKKLSTATDAKLAAKLTGRLLLQVENKGYIWYVNPADNKRYLISPDNALNIFKSLSLGISEANLNLIPTKESGQKGNAALRNKLKGKLLLRVESRGQISYVDLDGYRHDIAQSNLMDIFRTLSLGIADANIHKISIGELK
jgi:hypothetical protein